jgi:flavin-dependent dehydrogenase
MAHGIPVLHQPDEMTKILVAGGGLAGSAVATALAQAGVGVTLVERETARVHKICGEFLSAEAQIYLRQLGFDIATLGGAVISRLRLIRGNEEITVTLPFQGLGLSRFTLDEALLNHAAASGAAVLRGHTIRGITNGAVDIKELGTIHPETLFLATGKHEIRGLRRASASPDELIGFKTYFRLTRQAQAALKDYIDLILFQDGYAGLQLVEGGLANFCLLIGRARFQHAGGNWAGLLDHLLESSPYLARQLAGATETLQQPLSIYRVPFGFIHKSEKNDPAQVFRLGDQAGVIQSFTGDGMSIALHSAALAVEYYLSGQTAQAYHHQLSRDIRGQINRAGVLYNLISHSPIQAGLFGLARFWPGGLGVAAKLTRVPLKAMRGVQ